MDLVIATRNRDKFSEITQLLAGLKLRMWTPEELGFSSAAEETGESYRENAALKALHVAAATGRLTLADDSGLEVEALGGEPGLHSARFGGPGLDDYARTALLLRRLEAVPAERRRARFVCVVALADDSGAVEYCEGVCDGMIVREARGRGGFGYDPIFLVPALEKTFAELPGRLKNELSHRGRALRKARTILERVCSEGSLPEARGKRTKGL